MATKGELREVVGALFKVSTDHNSALVKMSTDNSLTSTKFCDGLVTVHDSALNVIVHKMVEMKEYVDGKVTYLDRKVTDVDGKLTDLGSRIEERHLRLRSTFLLLCLSFALYFCVCAHVCIRVYLVVRSLFF